MIAFKVFQLCPVEQRPLGIPLSYPWIQQSCSESEAPAMTRKGWTVMSEDDYLAYVASEADRITEYEAVKTQLAVEQSLQAAMNFGTQCLREFSAQNVLLGITQSGMTGTILTILTGVMQALLAGSLYEAMARVRAVDPADYDGTYLNATRCLTFINKIETYLGLPLSESL